MIKILFICHGSICRSPMAKYVLRHMVQERGLSDLFEIEAAATSREEIGNPVYPPARSELAKHGIACSGHSARQLREEDYEEYDYLIGMDVENLYYMHRICNPDSFRSGEKPDYGTPASRRGQKISLLMDYTERGQKAGKSAGGWGYSRYEAQGLEVADPWYTGDFVSTYRDVIDGCEGLLAYLGMDDAGYSAGKRRQQAGGKWK